MQIKVIKNQDGIALVTSLMLTLISMTIILALFYMMTAGVKTSGAQKRYKTSLEAAHGGVEIALKDIVPMIMKNADSASLVTQVQADFAAVDLAVITSQNCMKAKLTSVTSTWPTGCSSASSPKQLPDMTMTLAASTGNEFTIYAKIVDTVKGNTDTSGLQLEGSGVSESSPVLAPQHLPYVYRLEIQGERAANATEQANVSALYAY